MPVQYVKPAPTTCPQEPELSDATMGCLAQKLCDLTKATQLVLPSGKDLNEAHTLPPDLMVSEEVLDYREIQLVSSPENWGQ